MSSNEQNNLFSKEKQSFEELMTHWHSLSQDLLTELRKKGENVIGQRSSQSIMALGALEAHLKMAMQAKQASDMN